MMQLAKMVGEIATGEENEQEAPLSNPAAVKRGKARAAKLTPRKRKACCVPQFARQIGLAHLS